jgi:small-conductance mechanosensitive channel
MKIALARLLSVALVLAAVPVQAVRVAAPVVRTAPVVPSGLGALGSVKASLTLPNANLSGVSSPGPLSSLPTMTVPQTLQPTGLALSRAASLPAAAPQQARARAAAPTQGMAQVSPLATPEKSQVAVAQSNLSQLAGKISRGPNREPLSRQDLDQAWDRLAAKDGDGESPVPTDGDFGHVASSLQKLQKRSNTLGTIARGALVAAPVAFAPVAAKWAYQHPLVQQIVGKAAEIFMILPGWGQTGVTLAGGFGAAWLLPKVVRGMTKWVFKWVDWDPLREAFLVNVVSAASWIGAVGFAMYSLGGVEVLALNGTVFGITTTLATQDLMKNLTSGFSLYQNRPFELGQRIAIEDMKAQGQVIAFNPRFITLDARNEAEQEYETILLPNEEVLKKAVTNFGFPTGGALLGLGVLAAFDPTMMGPLAWGVKIFVTLTVAITAGTLFQGQARKWEARAKEALPDLDEYKRLAVRGKILSWISNAAYLGGLYTLLNMFGVPLAGLVGSLSLVTAAMGFWTKDVATNLVAGLMLAVWRPFTQGQTIAIGKHVGEVQNITQRYIILKLANGEDKYIPLSDLMKQVIKVGKKPTPPLAEQP